VQIVAFHEATANFACSNFSSASLRASDHVFVTLVVTFVLTLFVTLITILLATMTTDTYKQALKQAKADLSEQVRTLGLAQDTAEKAEKAIVELRQTIAALQRLCGEPEFVEEDALGLTDAIRMAFKTEGEDKASGLGGGMSAQDVRAKMESMGYGGRWGNLLASIHTVIKRLHEKGELQAAGNINGRETYVWKKGPRGLRKTLTPL
jgi:hypothetical protein